MLSEIKRKHDWEKPKRRALTEAQQSAFINYVASTKTYKHWLPIFTLLLGTGCRIGEVVGLRWEDCDFTKGIISINHNLICRKQEDTGKAAFPVTAPKTKAGIGDYNKEETERAQKEKRKPLLLPRFSAHNMRHTFCTRCCENERVLKAIQESVGHADITPTMDIYNEVTQERKMASFSNLECKIRAC